MLNFESKNQVAAMGLVAMMAFGTPLIAEAASINFENYNYTGTTTTYTTLSDAQNGTSSTGSYTIQTRSNGANSTLTNARDAYIYANTSTNTFLFGTAWYFNPQEFIGNGYGFGNPNNSNNGFIQLYDNNASSLSSFSMGWDPTLTQFSVNASGANAGAAESARFWPAPNPGGASGISAGTFVAFDYKLIATFATAAPSGSKVGETPNNVTGFFSAIFQNTGTDPSFNQFYVISLLFNSGSAAELNNYAATYAGYTNFSETVAETTFISPVPLPAALPLFASGLGMLALLGIGRRKKRKTAAA